MFRSRVIFFPRRQSKIILIVFLITFLCLGLVFNKKDIEPVMTYAVANKIIVIDAGHGGTDTGASRGEIVEKDITLEISKKLAKKLGEAGAAVVMIRETDTDMLPKGEKYSKRKDLTNRVKKANDSKADLYISIHTNAVPSPKWFGAQTFYNATSEKSKLLAVSIQDELTNSLKNTSRKALAGDYFVMNNTQMPAVIVEVGFISNYEESELLKSNKYQDEVAHAIMAGITKYMKNAESL